MSRLLKALGIGFAALVLVPVGALAISIWNDETLPQRTSRYDADLRAKVPPGSNKEQLRAWLVANNFVEHKVFGHLDRWMAEPPRSGPVTLWCHDPAWLSSAEMLVELQLDEQGCILSARITSRRISL